MGGGIFPCLAMGESIVTDSGFSENFFGFLEGNRSLSNRGEILKITLTE